MKIERLSENQIRCTLYKADLAEKELLLTELAYGTDKAKELFRELMQQASNELGFEVDNIPLMIEAIPVSPECLVLIITKVEDPDELDNRFSRFTKPVEAGDIYEDDRDEDDNIEMVEDKSAELDDARKATEGLLQALGNLAEGLGAMGNAKAVKRAKEAAQKAEALKDVFRVFAFDNLEELIISANNVKNIYDSENTLYKNPMDSVFYLYLTKDNNSDNEFVRTCNLLSEYGKRVRTTYATPSHMEEHYKIIIDGNALQTLSQI